jgi:hypothetical protein
VRGRLIGRDFRSAISFAHGLQILDTNDFLRVEHLLKPSTAHNPYYPDKIKHVCAAPVCSEVLLGGWLNIGGERASPKVAAIISAKENYRRFNLDMRTCLRQVQASRLACPLGGCRNGFCIYEEMQDKLMARDVPNRPGFDRPEWLREQQTQW